MDSICPQLSVVLCSADKFAQHVETLQKVAVNSAVTHKHAACLMKGGKVMGIGINKYFQIKMHNETMNLSVHAEMDVLAGISTKISKGMDILIIRVTKSLTLRNSRPCNVCIDKLRQRGIRKAYYSNSEGQIVYEFVDSMPKLHASSGCKARQRCS